MSIKLPTEPLAPTRINPKIILFYGMPKVGKTEQLTKLNNCLILDAEKGADTRTALRIPINSIEGGTTYRKDEKGKETTEIQNTSLNEVFKGFVEEAARQKAAGEPLRFPYKYIAFDTLDLVEDFCEVSATRKYKESIIGKTFEGKSVLELPNGGGYYYLRNEVLEQINRFAGLCETLILVSHVKEKLLNKGGIEVSSRDISLTGKLGGIVASKCDAIGYFYREGSKLMVNFDTQENAVMGARFPHLAGRRFEFGWNKIFLTPEQVSEPAK